MTTQLFEKLSSLANEIDADASPSAPAGKQAQTKESAPSPADPGGFQDKSTHPTTDADNGAEPATEGGRSAENEADNKSDQGDPGVASTPEANAPSTEGTPDQDKSQLNIGQNQSSTGADPAVEEGYKGTKEDAGYDTDTSHPAKMDEQGEKYSHLSLPQLVDETMKVANDLLADIVADNGESLNKASMEGSKSDADKSPGPAHDVSKDPKSKPEASHSPGKGGEGSGEESGDGDDKTAAEVAARSCPHCDSKMVDGKCEKCGYEKKSPDDINDKIAAATQAVNSGEPSDPEKQAGEAYEAGYELARDLGMDKAAAEQQVSELLQGTIKEAHEQADLVGHYLQERFKNANRQSQQKRSMGPMGMGGGMPYEEEGMPPAELMGGDGSGGGEAPAEEPPAGGEGAEGGEGLEGGENGELAGEPAPPEAAEPSEEEALQELAAALTELGGTEDELAGAGPEGAKLASAIKNFKRSGRFEIKSAGTKRSRELRDRMKGHLREILNR